MTQIVIDIGASANDGAGDPLRSAFNDVNLNFANVFAAGPVDSNVQIVNNTILTTNTNGDLVLAPNGIGKVVANVTVVPNTANVHNLGSANQRWLTVYSKYLNVNTLQLAVYANTSVRDSAISSPQTGMMVYVTGTGMQVYGATQWNTIAGTNT